MAITPHGSFPSCPKESSSDRLPHLLSEERMIPHYKPQRFRNATPSQAHVVRNYAQGNHMKSREIEDVLRCENARPNLKSTKERKA